MSSIEPGHEPREPRRDFNLTSSDSDRRIPPREETQEEKIKSANLQKTEDLIRDLAHLFDGLPRELRDGTFKDSGIFEKLITGEISVNDLPKAMEDYRTQHPELFNE